MASVGVRREYPGQWPHLPEGPERSQGMRRTASVGCHRHLRLFVPDTRSESGQRESSAPVPRPLDPSRAPSRPTPRTTSIRTRAESWAAPPRVPVHPRLPRSKILVRKAAPSPSREEPWVGPVTPPHRPPGWVPSGEEDSCSVGLCGHELQHPGVDLLPERDRPFVGSSWQALDADPPARIGGQAVRLDPALR